MKILLNCFSYLFLFYRILKKKESKIRFKEKIVNYDKKITDFIKSKNLKNRKIAWLHAVSVGESNSVISFAIELTKRGYFVVFTTTTITSAIMINKKMQSYQDIVHVFFPFAFSLYIKKFLSIWNPSVVFFTESEVWPSVSNILQSTKIPFYQINARLSDKSFGKWNYFINKLLTYPLINKFLSNPFDKYTCIYAQSNLDVQKFNQLKCVNVKNFGNLKLDAILDFINYTQSILPQFLALQQQILSYKKQVIFIANLHLSEIAVLKNVIKTFSKNKIIILAPRKKDDFNGFVNFLKEEKITYIMNSDLKNSEYKNQNVVIVDEMGIMGVFYQISDVSVVCGSFVDNIGGHSVLESIAMKSICVIGNYYNKCQDITNEMRDLNLTEIVDVNNLTSKLEELLHNSKIREQKSLQIELFLNNLIKNKRIYEKIIDDAFLI